MSEKSIASIQWKGDNIVDVRSFMSPQEPLYAFGLPNIDILTVGGFMTAAPGDWITRLRDGSFRVDSQPREHGIRVAFYSKMCPPDPMPIHEGIATHHWQVSIRTPDGSEVEHGHQNLAQAIAEAVAKLKI